MFSHIYTRETKLSCNGTVGRSVGLRLVGLSVCRFVLQNYKKNYKTLQNLPNHQRGIVMTSCIMHHATCNMHHASCICYDIWRHMNIEPNIEAYIERNIEPTIECNIEPSIDPNIEGNIEHNIWPNIGHISLLQLHLIRSYSYPALSKRCSPPLSSWWMILKCIARGVTLKKQFRNQRNLQL